MSSLVVTELLSAICALLTKSNLARSEYQIDLGAPLHFIMNY